MNSFVFILAFLHVSRSVFGLYFLVPQGSERCFFEEVNEKSLLSVSYDLISQEGKECALTISDSQKKVLKTLKLDEASTHNRMSFVAPTTGVYNVCVHCPGRAWYLNQACKISLNFEIADVGSGSKDFVQYDVNYETTAKKRQVDDLTQHLNHFIGSANMIQEYQMSENRNSTRLYQHYKAMNRWILAFYLLEILLVVLTSTFSLYYITRFFKTQCFI